MQSPRSDSRDLVDRYPGDRRRYFASQTWAEALQKFFRRNLWAIGVFLAPLIWLGYSFANNSTGENDYKYTHGPLTNPHAALDTNCEACHRPYDSGSLFTSSPIKPHERWLDMTCEKCHAGPAHHATAIWPAGESDAACWTCHHDHNGRTNSLVRIDDNHCTKCHANLPASYDASKAIGDGNLKYAPTIQSFADHPNFRKLDDEANGKGAKRTIQFSHNHHMTLGIPPAPGSERGNLTKAALTKLNGNDASVERRYFKAGDNAMTAVQLQCASCHQLDSGRMGLKGEIATGVNLVGEPKEAIQPPRAEGAYYLPINFDAHCRACHPLKSPEQTTILKVDIDPFVLPHRKQPAELIEYLDAEFGRQLLLKNAAIKDSPAIGKKAETIQKEIEAARNKAFEKLVSDVNPRANNALNGSTCAECHAFNGVNEPPAKRTVVPVKIPTVWFEHAKFNHVSHRAVNCQECHPGTQDKYDPTDAKRFDKDNKIKILGVESCRVCHAPQVTTSGPKGGVSTTGGVRHGCTDCHRYHNGEHAFQGRGATARDPSEPRLSTIEFMLGGTKPGKP